MATTSGALTSMPTVPYVYWSGAGGAFGGTGTDPVRWNGLFQTGGAYVIITWDETARQFAPVAGTRGDAE